MRTFADKEWSRLGLVTSVVEKGECQFEKGRVYAHCYGYHRRRCRFIVHHSAEQCKLFSLHGTYRCRFHALPEDRKSSTKMKYAHAIGHRLSHMVAEMKADAAKSPATTLKDELILMRALVSDSIAIYEAAASVTDETKRLPMLVNAGNVLREALNEVRDMTIAYAKVEKTLNPTMDVMTVNNIMQQITYQFDIALKEFAPEMVVDPAKISRRVAVLISENVKVRGDNEDNETLVDVDKALKTIPLNSRKQLLDALRRNKAISNGNGKAE